MIKRLLIAVAVVALSMAFAGVPGATVKGTKHDFSVTGSGSIKGTGTRICVFCHTPHNAVEVLPLWNRTGLGNSAFMPYTSSRSLTPHVKSNSAISSENVSYKCLYCHDGTLSIGGASVVNPGSEDMNSGNLNATISSLANIGNSSQDLTDDHPLGFDFSVVSGQDDKILPIGNAIANGMKFFKAGAKTNQMECASCHDVHNASLPAEPAFLRTSLLSGAICISCHDESKF